MRALTVGRTATLVPGRDRRTQNLVYGGHVPVANARPAKSEVERRYDTGAKTRCRGLFSVPVALDRREAAASRQDHDRGPSPGERSNGN
jgi:hypothetical protein